MSNSSEISIIREGAQLPLSDKSKISHSSRLAAQITFAASLFATPACAPATPAFAPILANTRQADQQQNCLYFF